LAPQAWKFGYHGPGLVDKLPARRERPKKKTNQVKRGPIFIPQSYLGSLIDEKSKGIFLSVGGMEGGDPSGGRLEEALEIGRFGVTGKIPGSLRGAMYRPGLSFTAACYQITRSGIPPGPGNRPKRRFLWNNLIDCPGRAGQTSQIIGSLLGADGLRDSQGGTRGGPKKVTLVSSNFAVLGSGAGTKQMPVRSGVGKPWALGNFSHFKGGHPKNNDKKKFGTQKK